MKVLEAEVDMAEAVGMEAEVGMAEAEVGMAEAEVGMAEAEVGMAEADGMADGMADMEGMAVGDTVDGAVGAAGMEADTMAIHCHCILHQC
jgi:hypothetical protein